MWLRNHHILPQKPFVEKLFQNCSVSLKRIYVHDLNLRTFMVSGNADNDFDSKSNRETLVTYRMNSFMKIKENCRDLKGG